MTVNHGGLTWRKSKHSGDEGNCVEIAWHKSTRSGNVGNCVEVAHTATTAFVRDSKDPDLGHLDVRPAAWSAFLATLRSTR
ncbi:protein of unknown function [Amycolatopsis arida]|uniref:DUF397 domain-containing protein n=1 Tax=Amycolatopsis arida TaxID=587909 RepID=A0A1I5LFJ6_9PSEU|nr:DUF397 domain-containing protein [Amycolatopsis arida]TDX93702.1 uncharacterized protein DUF397 [Amycolatopsis arida]SFO95962.1 protein of unknown function [Amycolatopsis arida]